ncbi:TPA: glycosyltransferase [Vibrio parahaemolyticus]|nr:glycosyltransferase [Vibrio parahaemolyticus]HCG6494754.1 glycosyltransferase [Vibrio parahaemolyticus]
MKIVILDPGLREHGGHHVGIASQIKESKKLLKEGVSVEVLGNVAAPKEVQQSLSSANFIFTPYFDSDFYQQFYSDRELSTFTSYVRTLSAEYFKAILSFKNSDVTFFYHTLNWEHGYALALALRLLEQTNIYKQSSPKHQHLIGLMFSPQYFNRTDTHRSQQRLMRFSLGFRQLQSFHNVQLFSADFEVRQAYRQLLDINDIKLFPCGLIRSSQLAESKCKQTSSNRVLLYVGDAKDNKGFLELPKLLESLLELTADPSVRFVIHYTITNDRRDLQNVHSQLTELAKRDSRIELHYGFLSELEMHELWLSVDSAVLNYDSQLYANQSSGILWLSAAYDVNVHLLSETWLNREARRLNLKCKEHRTIKEITRYIEENDWSNLARIGFEGECSQYRKILLSDLSDWLVNKARELANN